MEIKLSTPDGYSFSGTHMDDHGDIVVSFSEKSDAPPESWEDYCDRFPITEGEAYMAGNSEIEEASEDMMDRRHREEDRNLLPDKDTAKAVLAMCQITQLVKCYNKGWTPNWSDPTYKHVVEIGNGTICVGATMDKPAIMAFETKELRDLFVSKFSALIYELMPLYHSRFRSDTGSFL